MDLSAKEMAPSLGQWDPSEAHMFSKPSKRINEGQDVESFLVSQAYRDITIFLVQLNRAMFPRQTTTSDNTEGADSDSSEVQEQSTVHRVQKMLGALDAMVDEVPLDPGPRRFGNVAFRKWCELLEGRASYLLKESIPSTVIEFPHASEVGAMSELQSYLVGSFGSAQRLDYGTGHELSFLVFVAAIWKLRGFAPSQGGREERKIVIGIIRPCVS